MIVSARRLGRDLAIAAFVFVLGLGCGTDEFHENYPPAAAPASPSVDWSAPDLDATRALADFEARMVDFGPVGASFEVRSSEPMASKMRGILRLEYGQKLHLEADGRIAGKDSAPAITFDDERAEGGTHQKGFDVETPRDLRNAVAIGFVRMGVLHNIIMLNSGALPDHADGGVREWVTTANARLGAVEKTEKGDVRALSFDILVNGKQTADATLIFDTHRGWPLRRAQTVRFPTGTMTVDETYRFF